MTGKATENQQRVFMIDCIKGGASLLVVMQHAMSRAWDALGASAPQSAEWLVMNAVFMLTRMAAPLFFLCSGALMLDGERTPKRIWKQNIPRIMMPYLSWMSVYGIRDVVRMMLAGDDRPGVLVNAFLKKILFGHFHTWFLTALLGLYMITPVIGPALCKVRVTVYAVLLSFFFTCCWPLIERMDPVGRLDALYDDLGLRVMTGFLLYYLAGRLLVIVPHSRNRRIVTMLALAGGMIVAWWWSCTETMETGVVSQGSYTPLSWLGVLIACGIFYIAGGIPEPDRNGFPAKCVRLLSELNMGIYLIHPLFHEMVISRFQGLSSAAAGVLVWLIAIGICMPLYLNRWTRKVMFGITKSAIMDDE